MKLRALPQSFWKQPNVPSASPVAFPLLPSLCNRETGEVFEGNYFDNVHFLMQFREGYSDNVLSTTVTLTKNILRGVLVMFHVWTLPKYILRVAIILFHT